MSGELSLIIFIFLIFLAGVNSYHKLRIARGNDLYSFYPEAKRAEIFRLFYELHKQGKFEQDSSLERRQKWDADVFKEIKIYCTKVFEWRYLQHTGRRNQQFAPLHDDDYGKALSEIKSLLDNFDSYIKI